MSARLATPLVVLSLVLPTVASGLDSLTVEQRLRRIETQLAAVILARVEISAKQQLPKFRGVPVPGITRFGVDFA